MNTHRRYRFYEILNPNFHMNKNSISTEKDGSRGRGGGRATRQRTSKGTQLLLPTRNKPFLHVDLSKSRSSYFPVCIAVVFARSVLSLDFRNGILIVMFTMRDRSAFTEDTESQNQWETRHYLCRCISIYDRNPEI